MKSSNIRGKITEKMRRRSLSIKITEKEKEEYMKELREQAERNIELIQLLDKIFEN